MTGLSDVSSEQLLKFPWPRHVPFGLGDKNQLHQRLQCLGVSSIPRKMVEGRTKSEELFNADGASVFRQSLR